MAKPLNQTRRVIIKADEIQPQFTNGLIQMNGPLKKTTPCAFASMDNYTLKTPTVITVINTYVPVGGIFTSNSTVDFTIGANGLIRYNGVPDINVSINANWSWEIETGQVQRFKMSLDKNGTLVSGSECVCMLDDDNKYPRNAGCSVLCLMSQGDAICLKAECITGTSNIIVLYSHTTIVAL